MSETPAVSRSSTDTRRHDFDALRSVAILLGVVLHVLLSYMGLGGFWPVDDDVAVHADTVLHFIHGFRMHVFFLMSGFFTAMLWRKRGVLMTLKHRVMRVLLPLVVGIFTIVPLTEWAGDVGRDRTREHRRAQDLKERNITPDPVWRAIREGRKGPVEVYVASGVSLEKRDPIMQMTPMMMASIWGQAEIVEYLLDAGAQLNGRGSEGSSYLMAAAFFGRSDVATLLIDRGIDQDLKNFGGDTVLQSIQGDVRAVDGIAGIIGLRVDWKKVQKERVDIAEALGRPDLAPAGAIGSERLMLQHLWFLNYLCWLVAGFLVIVSIGKLLPVKRLPSWLTVSPLRWLWILPLTTWVQHEMPRMGEWGPFTGVFLIPEWWTLLFYAIFFGFGAMYFDADDREGQVGRWWPASLAGSLMVFITAFRLIADRGPVQGLGVDGYRWLHAFLEALFAWGMCFGMMGLFRHFFSKERASMRYISDASYWIYVMHQPLVIYMCALGLGLSISPWVKLISVVVLASAILLISYRYLVRYTPIGWFLNGPRKKPQKEQAATPPLPPGSVAEGS